MIFRSVSLIVMSAARSVVLVVLGPEAHDFRLEHLKVDQSSRHSKSALFIRHYLGTKT